MSKLSILAAAFALATAAFWATILTSPPKSQASATSTSANADPCVSFNICP